LLVLQETQLSLAVAYLMQTKLTQELDACIELAVLASDLQGKLGVIQGGAQCSPGSMQVVQQPLLICILAVQADLRWCVPSISLPCLKHALQARGTCNSGQMLIGTASCEDH
jgi:hypothetical protein